MYKYLKINQLIFNFEQNYGWTFLRFCFYIYLPMKSNLIISSALRSEILGLGQISCVRLHHILGYHPSDRLKFLTTKDMIRLDVFLRDSNILLTDKLSFFNLDNCRFYYDIRCYRGSRLYLGFPAHGQSTRTNGRTARKFKRVFKYK